MTEYMIGPRGAQVMCDLHVVASVAVSEAGRSAEVQTITIHNTGS